MNYEAVYRTAPATPGLLNIQEGHYIINDHIMTLFKETLAVNSCLQ